ncbi:hypothetical protein F4818DRAFT_317572 [Hypoxylon cercidicola]|nr:hypothetical protein F4818DRAFT_317572 [Hypoxylon cercidicola]
MGKPSRTISLLRVSCWIGSSIFEPGSQTYRLNLASLSIAALKLIVAWPLLCILACRLEGISVNDMIRFSNGIFKGQFNIDSRYDTVYVPHRNASEDLHHLPSNQNPSEQERGPIPIPLEHSGAATSGQQYLDNIRLGSALSTSTPVQTDTTPASLRPRYLCLVRDFEKGIYETVQVSDYLDQNGDDVDLEFVFVSYTRMQFRVATPEEIDKYEYPDEATREANKKLAQEDRETLARWGIDAAKRVGKNAFWLDFECVRNEDGSATSTSTSEDVYRICDIVRAAHSMIIAIGPPTSEKVASLVAGEKPMAYSRERMTPWLRQWGSRLWTLPELLLCPNEYRVRLYIVGDHSEPKAMAKRNFAERAWDDAESVKELVNHFEGSAILTHLHLIESALACFSRRQTNEFSQGDIAYAIMGLFPNRHRPPVDKNDSGFQAFAKLSLSNDSGAFLERLICLSPQPGAPWYQTEDRWGIKLSNIDPTNKFYRVLESDTILLDGVHGATIHWDNLDPEPLLDRNLGTVVPIIYAMVFVFSVIEPFFQAICRSIIAMVLGLRGLKFIDGTFLALGLFALGLFAVLAPVLMISTQTRAKKPLKSRLIGIEGVVDTAWVEKHIWGFNHGILTDTTPQSYRDDDDPGRYTTQPTGQGEFSFTLVDTHMMTLVHIHCNLPPVAMFICGQENERHRALLCSYDWRTQTFHRQTVLRVGRRDLSQMHQIDRIRFALASPPNYDLTNNSGNLAASLQPGTEASSVPTMDIDQKATRHVFRGWRTELLFFWMCIIVLDELEPVYLHTTPNRQLIYYLCVIGGQIPGFLLLSYLPLSEILHCVLIAKLLLLPSIRLTSMLFIFPMIDFILDGFLISTLIAFTLSWYHIEELALRFLLWSLVSREFPAFLVSLGVQRYYIHYIRLITNMTLCFGFLLFSRGFSGIIGRPKEVNWLAAHQKTVYSRWAATHKFYAEAAGDLWRDRKSLFARCSRPLFVLSISILTLLTSRDARDTVFDRKSVDHIAMIIAAILIGLVVWKVPTVSFAVMVSCSVLPGSLLLLVTVGLDVGLSFPIRIIMRLNEFVLPLLWPMIVRQASTWIEAAGAISLSFAGATTGKIIMIYSPTTWTLVQYLPMFLTQLTIWALLWVFERAGEVSLCENTLTDNTEIPIERRRGYPDEARTRKTPRWLDGVLPSARYVSYLFRSRDSLGQPGNPDQ